MKQHHLQDFLQKGDAKTKKVGYSVYWPTVIVCGIYILGMNSFIFNAHHIAM